MASDYTIGDIHAGDGKAREHVRTTAKPERDTDYGAPKSIITLSRIDEGDMYRLGRQQELNVRKSLQHPHPDEQRLDGISATFDSSPSWDSRSF